MQFSFCVFTRYVFFCCFRKRVHLISPEEPRKSQILSGSQVLSRGHLGISRPSRKKCERFNPIKISCSFQRIGIAMGLRALGLAFQRLFYLLYSVWNVFITETNQASPAHEMRKLNQIVDSHSYFPISQYATYKCML